MTPLYSKESQQNFLAMSSGNDHRLPIPRDDRLAIIRLIENGNEVIGVLTSAEQVLKNEGYAGMSIVVSDLIKKIKGEGS